MTVLVRAQAHADRLIADDTHVEVGRGGRRARYRARLSGAERSATRRRF